MDTTVLISTYWNVNLATEGFSAITSLVLISTYWNVNPTIAPSEFL